MGADCGRDRDRDGTPTEAFEPSLFVWATVMSRTAADRAIVDAGLKALAFDSGPPLVCDEPAAHLRARLRRARPSRPIGRHQPPRARRQDPSDPRPLRPHRQPLHLVCLHLPRCGSIDSRRSDYPFQPARRTPVKGLKRRALVCTLPRAVLDLDSSEGWRAVLPGCRVPHLAGGHS